MRVVSGRDTLLVLVGVVAVVATVSCGDDSRNGSQAGGKGGGGAAAGHSGAGRGGSHAGTGNASRGGSGGTAGMEVAGSGANAQGGAPAGGSSGNGGSHAGRGGSAGEHSGAAGNGAGGGGGTELGGSAHGGDSSRGGAGEGGVGQAGDTGGGDVGNAGAQVGATGGSGGETGSGGTLAGGSGNGGTSNGGSSGTSNAGSGGTSNAGSGGSGGGCPARLSPESCNGVDDDCDGATDNLGTFTCGIGACQTTVTACVGGALQVCVPLAPSTGSDGCDGIDNDCDGAVDEDCTECLHVALDGNDASALASGGTSTFQSVQAAIDFAAGHASAPQRVCVAPGAACGASAIFPGPASADLEMADGVDVLGGYESTGWTRCTNSTTHLAPATGSGVVFPASVVSRTVLDGFAIDRPGLAGTVAGITVDGGKGALISNVSVTGGVSGPSETYGVDLKHHGDGAIVRSRIDNGVGSHSAAVRAVSARVDVEDNCPAGPDGSGRCAAACSTTGPQIQLEWNFQNNGIDAIVLDDAPGSRVERSAICAPMLVNDATAIRVTGDGTGVLLRGNNVIGRASTTENFLLRLEHCAGASPWVVQNYGFELKNWLAGYGGPDPAATIRAAGDCHPVIEANRVIHGFAQTNPVTVVTCASLDDVASRCVLSNNPDVSGGYAVYDTSVDSASNAVAVDCNRGCSRVDHNHITGFQSYTSSCGSGSCSRSAVGLNLNGGSTWASSNRILGGALGWVRAIGVSMADPNGRLENNVIFGTFGAPASRDQSSSVGLGQARVGVGLLSYSGDVDSNFIAGSDGAPTATVVHGCASDGVDLSGGIFRNNVLTGGVCGLSILRVNGSALPTTFEHNALYNGAVTVSDSDYVGTGALLGDYGSGGVATGTMRFTAADVDTTLGGAGSFAQQCAQTSDRHLAPGSACIDAGTPDGAPKFDIDGDARDASPDVGPDEYQP